MVAESNRLCDLQMGKTGHHRIRFFLRQIDNATAQTRKFRKQRINPAPHIKADIGGHLIIARTPGMQTLARITDQIGQTLFDIHMHILKRDRPRKTALPDFRKHFAKPLFNQSIIGFAQHPRTGQHLRVGKRSFDILAVHAPVKGNRGCKFGNKSVSGFLETSAPGSVGR